MSIYFLNSESENWFKNNVQLETCWAEDVAHNLNIERSDFVQLLKRFSDDSEMKSGIVALQRSYLGPYTGPCITSRGGSPVPYSLKFQIPNFKFQGQIILGEDFMDNNGPEPLPWMDRKYKITLPELDKSLLIFTRSDLIAVDEYVKNLDRDVQVYFVTDNIKDEAKWKMRYPGAPSLKRLNNAADKLRRKGLISQIVNKSQAKNIVKTFKNKRLNKVVND
jgi:hypothetical protein